jgi:hypothetical protein
MSKKEEVLKRMPALVSQSEHYPKRWDGKVPKRVKMLMTVSSDIPIPCFLKVLSGEIYDVYTNSHGAIAVVFEDGKMLGVKPGEFEVVEWH